jgi:glutathione S-transferase
MVTVHHLDFSRSTRVLWLLEELGLEYDLVRYHRDVGGPAPADLKAVHPLGKSPVLVDGGLVLAESSAILRYIDRRYGDSRFTPAGEARRAVHDEWIDYVEGSLALPVLVTLIGGRDLPERIASKMSDALSGDWQHVANAVTPGPYLMGDQLTLADMQMSYLVAIAATAGMLDKYSPVERYLATLLACPALQRAIDKGGPMTR